MSTSASSRYNSTHQSEMKSLGNGTGWTKEAYKDGVRHTLLYRRFKDHFS
jgi:hypothetical protein